LILADDRGADLMKEIPASVGDLRMLTGEPDASFGAVGTALPLTRQRPLELLQLALPATQPL
jgi:hypothetical protein